jgi:hypothetical protein
MITKLKVYTDMSLLDIGFPVEMLIPYIGLFNKEDEADAVMYGRFDRFINIGKDIIEITNQEEADVYLLPIRFDLLGEQAKNNDIAYFYKDALSRYKKVITFAGHDVANIKVPYTNAIVFNSAYSKSVRPANVFSYPHFFEDFQEKKYVDFKVKKKSHIALIGFCGYAPPINTIGKDKMIGLAKLLANYLDIIQRYPDKVSHSYRARAIIGLNKSKKIKQNFILKKNFAFGPQGQLNTGNIVETNNNFRKNFIQNIIDSDYTLCVRGIGNNSVRFFETLCCGRIPIFINTDSTLPFDDIINWKEFCIWIEEKDIDRIDEIVANYHDNISEENFIAMQHKARKIWEDYLTPVGFFSNLYRLIM